MSRSRDLARLADLAQLMLDHRLGQLRQTADQLEQSRMQLTAVNQAAAPANLDPLMSARVGLDYDRWADVRRAELNLVIARRTATWLEARGEAQTAFGRVQALQGLAARVQTKH
jgi:hypothetical protein